MSEAPATLLIVDDEPQNVRALCDTLTLEGFRCHGCTSATQALAALREESFDVLLTDLMMPQVDGIMLMKRCRELGAELACIVMTGHGTISTAVEALKAGANDYVLKPLKLRELLPVLARALATRRLQIENIQLREALSIYELSRAITQGLEHAEIVSRTVAAAAQHSHASAVYLLTVDDQNEALLLAGSAGPGVQPLDPHALQLKGAQGWLDAARRALANPPAATADMDLAVHPFDARIGVALPIAAGDTLFGVLGFTSDRPQGRIGPGQLKALEVVAHTAARAFAIATLLRELRCLNEGLELRVEERTRELELANQDLESFSYSVSHDLREPVRAVEGFCEVLGSEFGAQLPSEARRLVERIGAGATRMTGLIDALLHLSHVGRQPLACANVPLRELALQVSARLTEALAGRAVQLSVADLPDCFGDARLLEQVLVNLLSNALKFTAGRDPARIEVGVLRQTDEWVYFVRDNGVGFDMRYAQKLFGVFQRLHQQEAFAGTGVGLSIVHRVISRHGGRVWADSRPDVGTTVFFTLPQAAQAAAQHTTHALQHG
jgi:signal transduction histidine kinase